MVVKGFKEGVKVFSVGESRLKQNGLRNFVEYLELWGAFGTERWVVVKGLKEGVMVFSLEESRL